MMFAGIIMEGGIVGYDSNTLTGGSGVRIFGIGASTQYQSDTVTVTLRTVSVATGEILTTVTVTKTVLSYMDKLTLLRFVDDGTQFGAGANALEGEVGGSINESINRAVDVAVQAAVIQTINEGARKGHWAFKRQVTEIPVPIVPIVPIVPVVEEKKEVKVEEKKDVLVQPQAQPETKTETLSSASPEVKFETKVEEKQAEPKALFGQRKLKEDEFIYKEPNDKSQKTWQFKKGTVVDVVQPGSEGWVRVVDSEKRGGWVMNDRLEKID